MDELDPWGPADPLAEALHFLRMSGAFYCRSDLTADWGMTLPPMSGYLWFHVIASGAGWLETDEADSILLQPGDFALVPHGEGHRLRSAPGVPVPDVLELEREQISDRYEVLRHGEGGAPTTLVCGAVRFDHPAARNLVTLLPAVILVEPSSAPQYERMRSTLRLMAEEAGELRPGSEAVITRLADILVIQALRSWIETDQAAETGWLGALRDRQVGRALSLIHRDPARAWTVDSLRARTSYVPLGLGGTVHGARGRAGDALRHAVAHAAGARHAPGRGRDGRPARVPPRLPVRSGVQPGVQACRRGRPGRRQARSVRVRLKRVSASHGRDLIALGLLESGRPGGQALARLTRSQGWDGLGSLRLSTTRARKEVETLELTLLDRSFAATSGSPPPTSSNENGILAPNEHLSESPSGKSGERASSTTA